ncbi:MAG: aminotransferase class IV [Paludibacter sp.]
MNKAFAACYPNDEPISVFETLSQSIVPQEGTYKCRVVYDNVVGLLKIVPYSRREIHSLKLVETELESRPYKLEDRTGFNAAFAQRGDCDDVLLVKNGLLTDTSYCNVALYDGKNWYTPRIPLLFGVNRAELLAAEKLIEKDIAASELKTYQKIALFNAMIEFGEMVLDIDRIL